VADTEEEQLDEIKAWWSTNGNSVIGIVVLGAVMYFGLNAWRDNTAESEIAASNLYEEVMTAAARDNLETASASAELLFSDHNETAYAGQARLAMARLYMDSARDQDAADTLRMLIASNPDKELAQIGRLRLAKVLLYQGKAEEVIELLESSTEHAFRALFSEVMGDAYAEMGSYAKAEEAYIVALSDNQLVPTVDTNLIQLKLNDLPLISDVEAAAAAAAAAQDLESVGDDASAGDDLSAITSSDDTSATGESLGNESTLDPSNADEPSMNDNDADDASDENVQNEMPVEGEVGAE